jgi:hypothetical protein
MAGRPHRLSTPTSVCSFDLSWAWLKPPPDGASLQVYITWAMP